MNMEAKKAGVTGPKSTTTTPTSEASNTSTNISSTTTLPSCPAANETRSSGSKRTTVGGRHVQMPTRSSKNADDASRGEIVGGREDKICDTAPASPGSPAGSAVFPLARVPAFSAEEVSTSQTEVTVPTVSTSDSQSEPGDVLESSGAEGVNDTSDVVQHSVLPSSASSIPWNGAASENDVRDRQEEDLIVATCGEDSIGSLRLEPDIELEPGVDLKRDLGLEDLALTADIEVDSGEEMGATVGSQVEAVGSAPVDHEGVDVAVDASTRPDDMGFEMIHKDEVIGAAVTDRVISTLAAKGARASHKAWAWSWSRG